VGYIDTSEERNSFHRTFGIEIKKIDEVDSFKNIDGLAAVIDECDFIVSGSNTSAHLSGALGKNTYLLAPDNSAKFWYWHDIEGKCLWYPTISIFNKGLNKTWQELSLDIAQRIEVDYEQE
jgi:ADP-heptose:LPS heptosyltransferase